MQSPWVYLRGAIRSLVAGRPLLASSTPDGKVNYKLRFFNYSYTSQRVLDISGGAPAIKKFVIDYIKSVKKTPPALFKNPLIVLLDNDEGGKVFYSLIREFSPTRAPVDGMSDFYYLAANVYVVFTPISKPGDNSSIEDFFDARVRLEKIEGKTFNPSNEDIDPEREYGKAVFAVKVVRPNIAKIDFRLFDPILGRIEAAMADHAARHRS